VQQRFRIHFAHAAVVQRWVCAHPFAGRAVTDDAVGSVQFDAFGDGGAADVGGGLRLARRLTQNGAGQGDNDQQDAEETQQRLFLCHGSLPQA
jgi:hypothetical protein